MLSTILGVRLRGEGWRSSNKMNKKSKFDLLNVWTSVSVFVAQ